MSNEAPARVVRVTRVALPQAACTVLRTSWPAGDTVRTLSVRPDRAGGAEVWFAHREPGAPWLDIEPTWRDAGLTPWSNAPEDAYALSSDDIAAMAARFAGTPNRVAAELMMRAGLGSDVPEGQVVLTPTIAPWYAEWIREGRTLLVDLIEGGLEEMRAPFRDPLVDACEVFDAFLLLFERWCAGQAAAADVVAVYRDAHRHQARGLWMLQEVASLTHAPPTD